MTPSTGGPNLLELKRTVGNSYWRAALLLTSLAGIILAVGCINAVDKRDAHTQADRINQRIRSKEFAEIYKASALRFKTVGSEADFVAWMSQLHETLGQLKHAQEIAYESGMDSRIGKTHKLVFALEFERGRARETLIMVRSPNGEMQLWKLGMEPAN